MAAAASKILLSTVPPRSSLAGKPWNVPVLVLTYLNPVNHASNQQAHQLTGSQAGRLRWSVGRPTRQMSAMIWYGNHSQMIGTNQAPMAHPGPQRWRQPRPSAFLLPR